MLRGKKTERSPCSMSSRFRRSSAWSLPEAESRRAGGNPEDGADGEHEEERDRDGREPGERRALATRARPRRVPQRPPRCDPQDDRRPPCGDAGRVEASAGGPAPGQHDERGAGGEGEEAPARHSRVGERRGLGRVRAHPADGDERPGREAGAERRRRRRRQPLLLHDYAGVGQEGEAEQSDGDDRQTGLERRGAGSRDRGVAGRGQSRCVFQGYEDFNARGGRGKMKRRGRRRDKASRATDTGRTMKG